MTDWIREWMLKLEPKIILQIFLLIKPTSLPKSSVLGSTHGLLRRVKLVKKLFRDVCHKNDKKTCTDHRRTISSSRHKAVVKLRRRESCREGHLGRRWATLQAARAKTTWTQLFASIQSSARTLHWPYPPRSQSKKDPLMHSSHVSSGVDTRLKGSGEWNYRCEQKVSCPLGNTLHEWAENGCFLSTSFSERERLNHL